MATSFPVARYTFLLAMTFLTGCMTSRDGRKLSTDMHELNIRLVNLEKNVQHNVEDKGKAAGKRLANSVSKVDKLERELQVISGDIDTLRVGVATGRLPGAESDAGSVADSLDQLNERVAKIEETQAEILEMLSKGKSVSKSKKRKHLTKLGEFSRAFRKRRYTYIVEDAPKALKKIKKADKDQIYFYEAESYFKLGQLRKAAMKYNQFLEKYPKGSYAPQAQSRMGDCFRHLGDKGTALIYYKELVEKYPNSEFARTAKKKIAKLEK